MINARDTPSPKTSFLFNHTEPIMTSNDALPRVIVNNWAHLRYSCYQQNVNMVPPNPERGAQPVVESNVPDRFELFMLADGEKKVTEAIDTRKLTLVPLPEVELPMYLLYLVDNP